MALQPQLKDRPTRPAPGRSAERDETHSQGQETTFSGPVCDQRATLPAADFDALVDAINSDEGPNEKLQAGAEWFKQNGC